MAAAKRPERAIKDWAHELDRNREAPTIARWTSVFEEFTIEEPNVLNDEIRLR